jgi:predicted DNA-binding transcriptional regulator YafY
VEAGPEVAFMARDALRQGWTLEDLHGGGGLLSFEATDRRAAVRFVARHLQRARIVAPATLRDEARDYFGAILAAHEGPAAAAPARPDRRAGRARR